MDFLGTFWDLILHIDVHLIDFIQQYGAWVYLCLFLVVFCETGLVVTPFLPGDSLLFAAGVCAGSELLSYGHVLLLLGLAGILGDACNYFIGRWVGPVIFAKETRLIKKKYLLQAHAFYERHGGKAIILARFIPIIRTFAPFVAGIALMRPSLFFAFNITGCILWVGGLVSAGYFLGHQVWVREHFSLIVYAIIFVSLLPLMIGLIKSYLAKNKAA
ncbi:MAG: VTT domain-containing protein [Desulfovibrionaceae bacterium]|nr:VTT domain-containing protein [Desulfovibrionaceae bacterium]